MSSIGSSLLAVAIFLGPLLLAYGVLVWRRKAATSRADGPGFFQVLHQAVEQGLPDGRGC